MTAADAKYRSRSGTPLRRKALLASAAVALSLLPAIQPAGADTFVDPNDRCLPDADAPPAPVTDRDRIAAVHVASVDCAFALGISIGMGNGTTYNPGGMTTRGQMASFIVRSLQAAGYELPAVSDQGFTDIDGDTHEDNINRLAAIGVTKGQTASAYDPGRLVNRDQMASFLVRAAEFPFDDAEGAFEAQMPSPFVDVVPGSTHAGNIAAASEVLGLTVGRTPDMYDPSAPTTRDQMATFLVRLVDITLVVE